MNSRERTIVAMSLEEPDVIPSSEHHINDSVLEDCMGKKIIGTFWGRRPQPLRELTKGKRGIILKSIQFWVDSFHKLGMDMVPANAAPPSNFPSTIRWIDECTWEKGYCIYRYDPITDRGVYIGGTFDPEQHLEDLKNSHEYGQGSAHGCIFPDDPEVWFGVRETIKLARKYDMAVFGRTYGFLQSTYMMWGMEKLLINIYRNPKLVEKIFDVLVENSLIGLRRLLEYDIDAVWMSDDFAYKTGPIISPLIFRKLLIPRYQRIIQEVKKKGLPFIWHSDGNTSLMLDDLIEMGVNGIQAIEGEAGMDIGWLKEKYGDYLFFMGNVDCGVLEQGTPLDVKKETKSVIDKAASGGGLIVASSTVIPSGTPIENVKAMTETTKTYGVYPQPTRKVGINHHLTSFKKHIQKESLER